MVNENKKQNLVVLLKFDELYIINTSLLFDSHLLIEFMNGNVRSVRFAIRISYETFAFCPSCSVRFDPPS